MTRFTKWTFAAALGACCILPSFAAGQTPASEAIFRPAESRASIDQAAYRRGWYGRPRYYGSYYRRPYVAARPYYRNYSRPGYYSSYYRGYYGPRVYSRPYYGRGYYGYGSPYYGYTYGRPAFRYGVGWY
jgi:hypothetical protein